MLKVGITGGIGSGKSTVCRIFEILGVPVYYADLEAKHLINSEEDIKTAITYLLGNDAYKNGLYNISYVKEKVFNNHELLNALNGIVHPAVRLHSELWMANHHKEAYVLKEAAIMEKGQGLDDIIYVHADVEVRIQRILKRDSHRSRAEILEIMGNQKDAEAFKLMADFVIENESQLLIPQVLEIHKKLVSAALTS